MAHRLVQLVACLQLTRIGLVFTAVSNTWMVALLSRSLPPEYAAAGPAHTMSLARYLLLTALTSSGLYIFGMTLNDVLDMRRDRLFAAGKPLPSRRVRPATAVSIAIGALLVAIAASLPLGIRSTAICLVAAGLALFYNGPAKRVSGMGILTLGLVRGGNMLVANPAFPMAWPVWLTMTHVIGLSALCHRLESKRPWLTGVHVWTVTLGWAFLSLVLLGWLMQEGPAPFQPNWAWVGPTALGITFVGYAVYEVGRSGDLAATGSLLMRRGLIWLIAYDAAWALGARQWGAAAILGALLPATLLLMTLVRWFKAWSEPMPKFQFTTGPSTESGLDRTADDR